MNLDSMVEEVLKIVPGISRDDVMKDLSVTMSISQTVNRIFDGEVLLKDFSFPAFNTRQIVN
jgi:hypothetical protein